MKEPKRHVYIDDFDHRLLVRCLIEARNLFIQEGYPTEDVDELISKVIDAPIKKLRIIKEA